MKVLAFDASTSTIGISLLSFEKVDGEELKINVEKIWYYKPPKKGGIFEKLSETRKEITKVLEEYKPDLTTLEDIIQYMPNKSQAKTTITLGILNRTVGTAIYDTLGKEPTLLNVMSIRHHLKKSKNEVPKKEDLPSLLEERLDIKFPYQYILKGKYKGDIAPETFDMSDSLALGITFIEKSLVPVKLKKKKSKKK